MGWFVIVVWECELKKTVFDDTVERIATEIVQNGERYRTDLEKRRTARAAYLTEQRARKEKSICIKKELSSL
jgi:hypothetical protein